MFGGVLRKVFGGVWREACGGRCLEACRGRRVEGGVWREACGGRERQPFKVTQYCNVAKIMNKLYANMIIKMYSYTLAEL